MLTTQDAADRLGITAQRMRQLCADGRVVGARRVWVAGCPVWRIPQPVQVRAGRRGAPAMQEQERNT